MLVKQKNKLKGLMIIDKIVIKREEKRVGRYDRQ